MATMNNQIGGDDGCRSGPTRFTMNINGAALIHFSLDKIGRFQQLGPGGNKVKIATINRLKLDAAIGPLVAREGDDALEGLIDRDDASDAEIGRQLRRDRVEPTLVSACGA